MARKRTAPTQPDPAPDVKGDGSYDSLMDLDNPVRRRGINSVETGMRVLECVVALSRPSSLKAIAARADLLASQAHRYVSSLVATGLLKQDRSTGLYDLGPAALRIGLAAVARHDAISTADEAARKFSLECGPTSVLIVWGSNGPTVVRMHQGAIPLFSTLAIGAVFPVTQSVAGRVFMSYLHTAELEPFLRAEGRNPHFERNLDLMAHRQRIREVGGDSGESTTIPGLRAAASPVFGHGRRLVAVLAFAVPSTVTTAEFEALTRNLAAHCRATTHDLAGQWPGPSDPATP